MAAVEVHRFARTLSLFDFPKEKSWVETARRVAVLVIYWIPYLLLDLFRPKAVLEYRKDNGNMIIEVLHENVSICLDVLAYCDEETKAKMDFSSYATKARKALNHRFQKDPHYSLHWGEWQLYRTLQTYPLVGSPEAPLNLESVVEFHLEGCCEADEPEIDAFFERFQSLEGKRFFLPRKHSFAHKLIQKHLDKVSQLTLIDFSCDHFEDGRSLQETVDLFQGKIPQFKIIRFNSMHTGRSQMSLATMQQLIRMCADQPMVYVNFYSISTEDFLELQQEFGLCIWPIDL